MQRVLHARYGAGWRLDRPPPVAGAAYVRFDRDSVERAVIARDLTSVGRPAPRLAVRDGEVLPPRRTAPCLGAGAPAPGAGAPA